MFAEDILHVGAKGLGFLNAAPSMGALLITLYATRKPPITHAGRNLLLAVAGFGVGGEWAVGGALYALVVNLFCLAIMIFLTVERGWAGFECLSGIPGLVGATPIQNVGAYGQEVADTIARVTAYDRVTGRTEVIAAGDCGFAYRTSRFKADPRYVQAVTAVGKASAAASGKDPITGARLDPRHRAAEMDGVDRPRTAALQPVAHVALADEAGPIVGVVEKAP